MQHLKYFVTIAVLGMLTLCFRHWPDLSREDDRGLLRALTQLPLLSIKRVVGAWSALRSLCRERPATGSCLSQPACTSAQ